MSFGFSVGDFVLAAEKGYVIYKKCADAPEQYEDLADAVFVLRRNLEASRAFAVKEEKNLKPELQEEDIAALVVARVASEKTLKKVDRFLDKHNRLDENVSKTLHSISRAAARGKFLFSGIEGLKQRVRSNAELLSQCLQALTSVSVTLIRKTLQKIEVDCRNGVRAKTVITAAVVDGERVNASEVLEQVQRDLVEENIHPDGIDLQFDIIQQWANGVADSGGLSESEDDGANLSYDPEKKGSADLPGARARDARREPVAKASTDADDDLYTSSVAPRDTNVEPPPERGRSAFLQPPSERTASRASSLGSHQSQESKWRPYSELSDKAQRYIHEMLAKALSMEPFGDLLDLEAASTYFKRAFSQQDAYHRGYLTQNEASTIGKKAVQEAGVDISNREIGRIIDGYDDGNAKIDQEEFLGIMHELRFIIHDGLKQKWRGLFDETNARAEQQATMQRLASPDDGEFLHWGFEREACPNDAGYLDVVENKSLERRPPVLPPWSFSVMAYEAANCVSVVDLAENEWWNKVLPDQQLRDQFHKTFSLIHEIALRFALFENKSDRTQLSDLDEIVSVVRLLAQTEGTQNIMDHPMKALCRARGKAYALFKEVAGFAYVLQAGDGSGAKAGLKRLGKPSTAGLTNDLRKWRDNHMHSWAQLIGDTADQEWPEIETAAVVARNWYETRGSLSNPLRNLKAKSVLKSKLLSEPDRQSLASTSHSLPANKLAESALFVASIHCKTIRTVEQADIEVLRASPRTCRMSYFEFERKDVEKAMFSFATRLPKCVVKVFLGGIEIASPGPEEAIAIEPGACLPPQSCSLNLNRDSVVHLQVVEMPKRKTLGECQLYGSGLSVEKDDFGKRAVLFDKHGEIAGTLSFIVHGSPDPDDSLTLTGPYPWYSLFNDAFESPNGAGAV